MKKRIAICMDGTWNKPGQTDNGTPVSTNVRLLYEAWKAGKTRCAGGTSRASAPNRMRRYAVAPWVGGCSSKSRKGYRFLLKHFQPGDEIYIYGFSRGAYSARSLAGMIIRCGVLKAEHADTDLRAAEPVLPLLDRTQGPHGDATDKVFALYKRAYERKIALRRAIQKAVLPRHQRAPRRRVGYGRIAWRPGRFGDSVGAPIGQVS